MQYTFKIEEKTVISFDGYMNLPDDLNRSITYFFIIYKHRTSEFMGILNNYRSKIATFVG